MFELTNIIYTGLIANPAVFAKFNKKVFPLLAPNKTAEPFITYRVRHIDPNTKDGINNYQVIIQNFAKTYNDAIKDADIIDAAMNELTPAGGVAYR